MISVEDLNDLNTIIEGINNGNITDEFLESYTENPKLLIKIISSVNKQKVNNLKSKYAEIKSVPLKKDSELHFTEDEVLSVFNELEKEEIATRYTVSELKAMYFSVCSVKPLSAMKKKDLIDSIMSSILYQKRNVALASL